MRYAIFSDVHSNLEAFEAVLDAFSKEKPDKYFGVGDVVGYGADPKACIKLTKELNPAIICGNHDWGVVDLTDISYFNAYARAAVLWTRGVLDEPEKMYLRSLKLVHVDKKLTMVHGTLDNPEAFDYIFDTSAARRTIELLRTNIGFVGHSHQPWIFVEVEDYPEYIPKMKVKLEADKRYLVNVGSVGQPRDGDPRAAYCMYDTEAQTIEIKRVEYDIEKAQEKILKAGLPEILAVRLAQGR